MLLWFPVDGSYYDLFIARPQFDRAADVFTAVLDFQRGTH
jgi:hypothetical protein